MICKYFLSLSRLPLNIVGGFLCCTEAFHGFISIETLQSACWHQQYWVFQSMNTEFLFIYLDLWSFIQSSIQISYIFHSVQFSCSSCLTLCDPMNHSTPGLPVHHHVPEFTQTHVHQVADAIQPSHPLSSPSSPASSHFQHQSLFQWVNSSHEVAKVLEFQLQHQSFQWTPWTGLISFRMDWLDLLAVQGTLKSLLQHHSSKASIIQRSAFFTI